MTLPLKPTRLEHTYEVGDESGYRFTVVASYDAETGWSASVHMATHGYKTPEAAVEHLRHSAEAFLRQLDAKQEASPQSGDPACGECKLGIDRLLTDGTASPCGHVVIPEWAPAPKPEPVKVEVGQTWCQKADGALWFIVACVLGDWCLKGGTPRHEVIVTESELLESYELVRGPQ